MAWWSYLQYEIQTFALTRATGEDTQDGNVYFINLQYGDCTAELNSAREKHNVTVHDWNDANPLEDMDDFAAKVAALDLVLSIDNSTVHLSGALGIPTWLMQPYSPDWRWLPDRQVSHWYPSVQQYRQTIPGNWDNVIGNISDSLISLSNDKSLTNR